LYSQAATAGKPQNPSLYMPTLLPFPPVTCSELVSAKDRGVESFDKDRVVLLTGCQ